MRAENGLRNVLAPNVETPIASRQPRHNSQNLKGEQFANRLEPGKHAVIPPTVEGLEHESEDSLNGTGSPAWLADSAVRKEALIASMSRVSTVSFSKQGYSQPRVERNSR